MKTVEIFPSSNPRLTVVELWVAGKCRNVMEMSQGGALAYAERHGAAVVSHLNEGEMAT